MTTQSNQLSRERDRSPLTPAQAEQFRRTPTTGLPLHVLNRLPRINAADLDALITDAPSILQHRSLPVRGPNKSPWLRPASLAPALLAVLAIGSFGGPATAGDWDPAPEFIENGLYNLPPDPEQAKRDDRRTAFETRQKEMEAYAAREGVATFAAWWKKVEEARKFALTEDQIRAIDATRVGYDASKTGWGARQNSAYAWWINRTAAWQSAWNSSASAAYLQAGKSVERHAELRALLPGEYLPLWTKVNSDRTISPYEGRREHRSSGTFQLVSSASSVHYKGVVKNTLALTLSLEETIDADGNKVWRLAQLQNSTDTNAPVIGRIPDVAAGEYRAWIYGNNKNRRFYQLPGGLFILGQYGIVNGEKSFTPDWDPRFAGLVEAGGGYGSGATATAEAERVKQAAVGESSSSSSEQRKQDYFAARAAAIDAGAGFDSGPAELYADVSSQADADAANRRAAPEMNEFETRSKATQQDIKAAATKAAGEAYAEMKSNGASDNEAADAATAAAQAVITEQIKRTRPVPAGEGGDSAPDDIDTGRIE